MDREEIHQRFDAFIRTKGLRRTAQRAVIVEAAFSTQDHFTADELWEKARVIDPNTSRATLYRTLALLVESELLRELDLGRGRVCYDPNFLDHPDHNHLICVDCEKVVEFEDTGISVMEDCITKRLGFSPAAKAVRIEAHCEELKRKGICSRSEENKEKAEARTN